jgi:hypothetical protein
MMLGLTPIRSIQRSLDGLFANLKAVSFDGDVSDVTALVTEAPKIEFKGGSPKEHRAEAADMHDDIDDGGDGLMDAPETGEQVAWYRWRIDVHHVVFRCRGERCAQAVFT